MNHEPTFKRPGARVRYNYTDGPVPAGTLGTVLGFLGRSQQAQIRWDDETVSAHTPDEFDVVPRGTRRAVVGMARRGKKTFETYASEIERALIASGVRPGQADVWISNHGSFIDQQFKSGTSSAETAERILESERHSAIPWVDEARRRTLWSDWDILDSVERHHGMTTEAKDRAFELIDLGYIDATGTWKLTPKGRRAWERDAPNGGWSDRHERLSAGEARRRHATTVRTQGTTYEEAKRVVAAAEAENKAAGDVLDTFPKLANGLTPDSIRLSPEYKTAKARYNAAFAHLRRVNEWFVKNFKKEIRAERASRGR